MLIREGIRQHYPISNVSFCISRSLLSGSVSSMSVLSTLCPNIHMFYKSCVLPVIKGSDLEGQLLQTCHWLLYQMYIFLISIFLEKNIHPNSFIDTYSMCDLSSPQQSTCHWHPNFCYQPSPLSCAQTFIFSSLFQILLRCLDYTPVDPLGFQPNWAFTQICSCHNLLHFI